ncbi:MAG: hypothetical protein KDD35_10050, partial [Bdellovibrionales bacterium]|nr:hypothetical protein [Bdellovibrionales bacterium]
SISGFLFYTFKFFYKIEVDPRKLYTLSVFASLPFLIAVIFSPFFRPISIVGLGFSGWLVYLGSIAHFQIPRKSLGRILLVLFSLYLLFWASNLFNRTKKEDAFRKMATPESLDILENELKEE